MFNKIAYMVFITMLPFLELRASIPYGINVLRMPWPTVFIVCIIANILIGVLIYFLLDKFVHFFLRYKFFSKPYNQIVLRTQKNIQKSVDKYGELGVALFIGVPLPGSGVYSGALGAYVIGLNFKKFIIADIIGVLIAGTIVTIISTGVLQLIS
ncbi:MAG TPA: hypothetical protein ENG48_08710 [Candidatus Atribacteria bacterium]|nr:hypothetical protein [Candidatus Atribacteria bacterium]